MKVDVLLNPSGYQPLDDLVRHLHAEANRSNTVEECYFIGADNGPVKIGRAKCSKARLNSLQTASPYKLKVLVVMNGGAIRERAFHLQFRSSKLQGEWFERTADVQAFLDKFGSTPLLNRRPSY